MHTTFMIRIAKQYPYVISSPVLTTRRVYYSRVCILSSSQSTTTSQYYLVCILLASTCTPSSTRVEILLQQSMQTLLCMHGHMHTYIHTCCTSQYYTWCIEHTYELVVCIIARSMYTGRLHNNNIILLLQLVLLLVLFYLLLILQWYQLVI